MLPTRMRFERERESELASEQESASVLLENDSSLFLGPSALFLSLDSDALSSIDSGKTGVEISSGERPPPQAYQNEGLGSSLFLPYDVCEGVFPSFFLSFVLRDLGQGRFSTFFPPSATAHGCAFSGLARALRSRPFRRRPFSIAR